MARTMPRRTGSGIPLRTRKYSATVAPNRPKIPPDAPAARCAVPVWKLHATLAAPPAIAVAQNSPSVRFDP